MLVLFAAGNLVILFCILAGRRMFRAWFPDARSDRAADDLFVSFWLGLAALLGAALLFASVFPMRYFLALVVPACIVLGSLDSQWLAAKIRSLSPAALAGAALAEIVICGYMARPYNWFDTFLYHLQIIDWYTAYGAVPGMGLLSLQMGTTSSWFALAAAFQLPFLQGREGTVLNCAWLCFVAAYAMAVAKAWIQNRAFVYERFWLIFTLLVLVVVWFVRSTAPDGVVAGFMGAIVWLLLRQADSGVPAGSARAGSWALPLMLAAAAYSVKPQAGIAFGVLLLFYLWQRRREPVRALVPLIPAAGLLAATSLVSVISTGCLLYPASPTCLEPAWGYTASAVRSNAEVGIAWDRWDGPAPADRGFANWLSTWTRRQKLYIVFLALNLAAALWLGLRVRKPVPPEWISIALVAAAGTATCLYAAPILRLAIGYVALLPALAVAAGGSGMLVWFSCGLAALFSVDAQAGPFAIRLQPRHFAMIAASAGAWALFRRTRAGLPRTAALAALILLHRIPLHANSHRAGGRTL